MVSVKTYDPVHPMTTPQKVNKETEISERELKWMLNNKSLKKITCLTCATTYSACNQRAPLIYIQNITL